MFRWITTLLCTGVLGQTFDSNFIDSPPADYYQRLNFDDCPIRFYGLETDNPKFGIHGGLPALPGEFPHMVGIGWTNNNGEIMYLCGGALLSKNYVLTAAHCSVNSENKRPDTVRVGDTDLASQEDDEYAQQVGIKRFINHPNYRASKNYYDIALIELQQPVKLTDRVCPACLWLSDTVPKEILETIGFGTLGFGEALSPVLQKANLSLIEQTECAERIPVSKRRMPDGLTKDQFCAGSASMDACEGDSGGPIQVYRVDERGLHYTFVVGVVSFGTPCTNGSTGVYTKTNSYVEWIEKQTGVKMDYTTCSRTPQCSLRKQSRTPLSYERNLPFRLGLIWNSNEDNPYSCGGTLIDYQYVLTSASCVTSTKGEPSHVALVEEQVEMIKVIATIVHPDYMPGQPGNDIALLKLEKFVDPQKLKPACLSTNHSFSDVEFTSHSVAYNAWSLEVLPKRDINMIHGLREQSCNAAAKNMLCFKNQFPIIPEICQMDYGGPVTQYPLVPVYSLGIVSQLSRGCGDTLHMTDVTAYVPWIESVVFNHLSDRLIFN